MPGASFTTTTKKLGLKQYKAFHKPTGGLSTITGGLPPGGGDHESIV
jgi:hypothetical protein